MSSIIRETSKNGYELEEYVIYSSANKYETVAIVKAFRDNNTLDLLCIGGDKRSTQRTHTYVEEVSFSDIQKASGRMQYNMDDDTDKESTEDEEVDSE